MSAPFALALLRLDGVGRVTAHRSLDRWDSLEALRATPREQVRLRLKGAPRADATVEHLFNDALDAALEAAQAQVEALAPKGISVLASGDDGWPAGLDELPASERPVCLWRYGHADALAPSDGDVPALALLGRAGLPPSSFGAASALAERFASGGLVSGAKDGFDLAVQKTALGAGGRVVAVAPCGLAKLEPSLRPGATALVRAGGALVSPFPMGHGPFDHDQREAALVAAALARTAAGSAAATPEARALAWAAESSRVGLDLDARASGAVATIETALAGETT
ncbi:MAG: DNA-processing protein DprA [Bacteroidota bacterium]